MANNKTGKDASGSTFTYKTTDNAGVDTPHLNVDTIAIQYTEGDTDATIAGLAMLWEDAGDALTTVSAATPLPVDATGTVALSATEVHIGQVGGSSTVIRPTVTVTAGAYSAGDVIGGRLTLTSAMRVSSGTGIFQDLVLHTADGETPELWVPLFDSATASSIADNAAFAWGSGDEDKLLTMLHIEAADWITIGGDAVCHVRNIGSVVAASGSQNLYAYLVAVGTPTFAATTDVTAAFTFVRD